MKPEVEKMKKLFVLSSDNVDVDLKGIGIHNTSNVMCDDETELITYAMINGNGYRWMIKKEKYVYVDEDDFSWDDYGLNPEDFDEEGNLYSFHSEIEDDGFDEIELDEALSLIESVI